MQIASSQAAIAEVLPPDTRPVGRRTVAALALDPVPDDIDALRGLSQAVSLLTTCA